jgi:hypothetical protein
VSQLAERFVVEMPAGIVLAASGGRQAQRHVHFDRSGGVTSAHLNECLSSFDPRIVPKEL